MTEKGSVRTHFADRASTYDRSSSWCTDDALGELMLSTAAPRPGDAVLDVACGTGLVSRLFAGRVRRLVGVDITPEMAEQARDMLDELVIAPAEKLPFEDGTFDIVVCRQGIQFMTLPDAVREMVRVTRPGGRIVLTHLCAYGDDDRDEYFEILRLRNPARRHFFRPGDVEALLAGAGCDPVRSQRYVSVEDVDVWSDNGAIGEDAREAIRDCYGKASPAFRARHAVAEAGGRITDHMLFVVASGTRV
ncbi:methyltransferase domain-containing protein [Streptomyces sp. NPDC005963]|uniref:class I SAM-dependent methyltransferase n=1 Tax=Streptomyces sp. NPDC005963 TaxID=3156721 RepID=UPI0033F3DA2C